ncbi:MAG: hypothetical protein H6830_12845 [Planctomycetes bacterium]|nr:hypothetical protein [Planctomycetota bacterium]
MDSLQPANLRIDNPCPRTWEGLQGDGARRFCSECQLHVLDGTRLTKDEAERLVHEGEGRVCMRVPVGPDGRLLFRDPEQARRSGLRAFGWAVAASGVLAACQPIAHTRTPEPQTSEEPYHTPTEGDLSNASPDASDRPAEDAATVANPSLQVSLEYQALAKAKKIRKPRPKVIMGTPGPSPPSPPKPPLPPPIPSPLPFPYPNPLG